MSETKIVRVDPKNIKAEFIHEAAHILKSGGLVIMPTETVYGVGANMLNQKSLDRLYEIKKRPKDKPFSVHIADQSRVDDYAASVSLKAYKLMDRFWPGPLTLILKSIKPGKVGLRMPDNEIALRIIKEVYDPVALPSANLSGNAPAKDFEEAIRDLDKAVDYAIDAGETRLGLESSIVDLSGGEPVFIRIGAIKREDIEGAMRKKNIVFVCTGNSCRSVMAEAYLKKVLKEKGREDVKVFSAGTMMLSGLSVSSGTREVLSGEGIDVSGHLSQKLTRQMALSSDLVLVMEVTHKEAVLRLAPEVKNRVFLLKEFAKINDGRLDIADPIGRPLDFYEKTFASIKDAVERVSKLI